MATQNDLLKERVDLVSKIKEIQNQQGKEAAKLDDEYIKIKGRLQEILKTEESIIKSREKSIANIRSLNSETQQLSSVYKGIKDEVSTQLRIQTQLVGSIGVQLSRENLISETNSKQSNIVNDILEAYEAQASISQELAQLTEDDSISRAKLIDDMKFYQSLAEDSVKELDGRTAVAKEFNNVQQEIEDSLKSQYEQGKELSSLSIDQKNILETQATAVEGTTDAFGALGSTITTWLQKPETMIGAMIGGLGHVISKIGHANEKMGMSAFEMDKTAASAGLMSLIFSDAVDTAQELTSEFGSVEAASYGTQANIGLMSSYMGITSSEAVKLTAMYQRMGADTSNVAADMIESTRQTARLRGVIPSAVLKDMAQSTEAFALYAKEGTNNIGEAAIAAQQLGVGLSEMTTVTDSLLDFESSMTKEMELGAMLGRNINLNKARQLAYDQDIEGAVNETLKQLGGVAAYNKMDIFQKRESAALLGVSVAQMEKMVKNQHNLENGTQTVAGHFSKWHATLDVVVNDYLGTGLKALGGWVASGAQFGAHLSQMGMSLKGIGGKLKGIGGKIAGVFGAGKSAGGGIAESVTGGLGKKTPDLPKKSGGGISSIAKGISKINPTKLIAGAAALVIAAGAVWVLGKGLQEFKEVGISDVGVMAAGIVTLSLALAGLSLISGPLLIGAAALLVAAGAVWVLGKGLQELAIGFSALNMIAPIMGNLIGMVGGIGQLSLAFMGLAASLSAVGIAGILALPALMGVSLASTGIAEVAGLFGIGKSESTGNIDDTKISEYETQMLSKMDKLINAVGKNRDVYLDKTKVTSIVTKTSEKSTGNVFGLGVA